MVNNPVLRVAVSVLYGTNCINIGDLPLMSSILSVNAGNYLHSECACAVSVMGLREICVYLMKRQRDIRDICGWT